MQSKKRKVVYVTFHALLTSGYDSLIKLLTAFVIRSQEKKSILSYVWLSLVPTYFKDLTHLVPINQITNNFITGNTKQNWKQICNLQFSQRFFFFGKKKQKLQPQKVKEKTPLRTNDYELTVIFNLHKLIY